MTDYDITTDAEGHIKNGLRADVMRSCMENKNLLEQAGSIYVGTGEKIVIGEGTDKQITIAKTAALNPGNLGEVLMVKDGELKYSKLSEANFSYTDEGVVEGDFGSSEYPLAKSTYFLKKDLYTSISQDFTGTNTITMTISRYNSIGGYLSIILGAYENLCVDFGFMDFNFSSYVVGTELCKLQPINIHGLFSKYPIQTLNDVPYIFLYISLDSVYERTLALKIQISTNQSSLFAGANKILLKSFRGLKSIRG